MVKKLCILLAVLMMFGCSRSDTRMLDEEKYNAYLTYYQALLDYENKQTESDYYTIEVVANVLAENHYRYDVVLYDPLISMYDVQILAVIENVSGVMNTDVMMPSEGIFGDVEYNMIPNQIDRDKNFVAGFDLSLRSEESPIHIDVMVSWKDKNKTETYKEFFSLVAMAPDES